jgi:antitoxin component YwqK of YwqJK toxin-antitoxin module
MPAEVALLSDMPYRQFQGPFVSQAEFDGGKLNGRWTIYDSKQHKISEWNYVAGRRHGVWTSWYASGRKMREANYINGDLEGTVTEWSPDGSVTTKDTYQGGHKLARKVEYYTQSQKKSEGMYLFAKQESKFTTIGKDERHGESMTWHPNGQVHVQGSYEHDAPVGTHTWWYANGQKAVEGCFTNGQRHGQWTWYHQNGQKSTHGEFVMGGPHGRWIWWSPAGKVAQKVEYSAGGKTEASAVVADKGPSRVGDKVEGTEPAVTESPDVEKVESDGEKEKSDVEPAAADAKLVPEPADETATEK